MTLPLVIGQAPSRITDGRGPLPVGCRCRDFMARVAGFDLLDGADAVNLLLSWPGKCGKGDAFPAAEARSAAAAMLPFLRSRPAVLLLGRRVAAVFGEGRREYLRPFGLGGAPAAVLPHLSGVNAWWNDAANRRR